MARPSCPVVGKVIPEKHKREEEKMAKKPAIVTCGYCGAQVHPDHAWQHVRMHENIVFVSVSNFTPRLVRQVKVGDSSYLYQYADPQPPFRMLVAAVKRARGALNISGIYPASESLLRWVLKKAPDWETPA
jgi:hypothetical protein